MFSKKVVLKVEGMHCEHCALKVQDALKKIDGIKSVKINLNKQQAIITYKNDLSFDKIKEVIESVGYQYKGVVE